VRVKGLNDNGHCGGVSETKGRRDAGLGGIGILKLNLNRDIMGIDVWIIKHDIAVRGGTGF
jgi:hypothetical protein